MTTLRLLLSIAMACEWWIAVAPAGAEIVVTAAAPLVLDNSSGAAAGSFGTEAISFQGGSLTVLTDPAGATAGTSGTATLASGQSLVDLFTSEGGATTFTFASLADGGTGTLVFTGGGVNGLGTTTPTAGVANAFFTVAPTIVGGGGSTPASSVGIVPRFLVTGISSGDAYAFATYTADGGVRALGRGETSSSIDGSENGDNVLLEGPDCVTSSKFINSLAIVGADAVVLDADVHVSSGALIALSGPSGITITTSTGGGRLFLGEMAYVTVDGDGTGTGRLTIDVPVVTGGSSNGLVKSGGGTLVMSSGDPLGGSVAVNAGALVLPGDGPLSRATVIRVEEGSRLELSGERLTSIAGGAVSGAGSLAFAATTTGTVDVGSGTLSIATPIESGGLVKNGAGTLVLAADASLRQGAVTVVAGRLVAAGEGPLSHAESLVVRSGATLDVSPVGTFTVPTVLGGDGTVSGDIVLGGTIDPSAATGLPGTLVLDNLSLAAESRALVRLFDATGSAGEGWGLASVLGTLDVGGISEAHPLIVSLVSIQFDGSAGEAINFDPDGSFSWTFAEFQSLEGAFAPSMFVIDDSQFLNPHAGGTFSVVSSGSGLAIQYSVTPVPEPSALPLAAMALCGTILVRFASVWRGRIC